MDAPQFTTKTRFGTVKRFEIAQDGTIRTEGFLQACIDLTCILDQLGTGFLLAKKDMLGNITKIDDHYSRNPQLYATLNAILEEESNAHKKPSNTAVSVIWLKRALEFLRAFITGLSKEYHEKVQEENLRQTVLRAYEGTLRHYHGIMTQFLFSSISRLVPYRKVLFKALLVEHDGTDEMIISDIDLYLVTFTPTLDLLDELLNHFGLRSQERV